MRSKGPQRPGFVLLRDGAQWRIYRDPEQIITARDAESLRSGLARIHEHVQAGGEAAGLLTYEAGYALEPCLLPLLANPAPMLSWFGLYAKSEIVNSLDIFPANMAEIAGDLALTIPLHRYCGKVEAIRNLIAAGEVYQINFTDRLHFEIRGSAWGLFTSLYREHPTPYAAFLDLGDEQVVSLSPELFFRIEAGRITVQPMKGTSPRGSSAGDDLLRAEALQRSEKERAENVMIVDLMRNDLGRICWTGSVKTTKLFQVEQFPSVWQMTSTIEGQLEQAWTPESLLRALFPSGSVTGAPKIRAMQCIAALEKEDRGIYTGGIGYFAPGGAQFSVAIRTAVVRGERGVMGVGSGITYDSSPLAEWEECGWKAAFLTRRTPEFEIFETLLWENGCRQLDAHLKRMAASAKYFQFPFDENKARNLLNESALTFSAGGAQRARIALRRDGELQLQCRPFTAKRHGRVRISDTRVSSGDRFLFHKTTHRRLYDEEFKAAQDAECDDALFLNERGEVTEGAIHNVFIQKDGIWYTPPVQCGLLPGVYRAMFLASHPEAGEAVLTVDDLLHADGVYLCNSVRGIYAVELVRESSSVAATS